MHPAKLAFQALRIHLNDEFGEMRNGMRRLPLDERARPPRPHGHVKHSECAIVVDVFRELEALRNESPLAKYYQQQQAAATKTSIPSLPSTHGASQWTTPRALPMPSSPITLARGAPLHVLRKVRMPKLAGGGGGAIRWGWGAPRRVKTAGMPVAMAPAARRGSSAQTKAERKAERKAAERKAERKRAEAQGGGGARDDSEDADDKDQQKLRDKKEKKRRKKEEKAAAQTSKGELMMLQAHGRSRLRAETSVEE